MCSSDLNRDPESLQKKKADLPPPSPAAGPGGPETYAGAKIVPIGSVGTKLYFKDETLMQVSLVTHLIHFTTTVAMGYREGLPTPSISVTSWVCDLSVQRLLQKKNFS